MLQRLRRQASTVYGDISLYSTRDGGGFLLGPVEDDIHECHSLLSYIAALTRRIKLGTMVTGNIYRHHGVLVKTVTTLDALSKGRAIGIGAGWFERESVGLGIPFHNWKIRFKMLEETLQIVKQMWSKNNGEFVGNHYKLKRQFAVLNPFKNLIPLSSLEEWCRRRLYV